jgi:hypothetical protein
MSAGGLQQRGYRLAFSPGGFVWHYRRNTVRAYLKQQTGYGEAEPCLNAVTRKTSIGSAAQSGTAASIPRRASASRRSVPIIYHGLFGTGFSRAFIRRLRA